MATNILQPVTKDAAVETHITSLQEIAETIQHDALQHARTKSIQPMRAADLAELLQWHDFVNYFRLGMADRIANTLTAYDDQVQAVYYFDPHLNPDAETETYTIPDPTVNLLVQVDSKSAALHSFIAALDNALAEQARRLPSPLFGSLETILNGIVITEEDVQQKRGYAALLSSLYLRPRQIL